MTMQPEYAIGLDVGGTKIAAGVVELTQGTILARRTVPTEPRRGGDAVLASCLSIASDLHREAGSRGLAVRGIGVGIAEMVDLAGRLTSAETIDWRGLNAVEAFISIAPAVIDSDARAGALAEAKYGKGREYSSFLYVTVGTGISYTLVLDGKPYAGARGNAIVFANSPMTPVCHACGAVSTETLEGFAGGPALVRRFLELGGEAARGHDVLTAAHRGDAEAVTVVTTAASALGVGVGSLVNALDPAAVLVGGGLGTAEGLYWQTFVKATRAHIWAPGTRGLPIETSPLGTDTGLLGAAALVQNLLV